MLNKLIIIWVQIKDLYLYLFRHAVVVNAYVDNQSFLGIRHRNWGDDLNYYLIRTLAKRPIVIYNNFWFARKLHLNNYLCIGSLVDSEHYTNTNTIVWGSGASSFGRCVPHPKKICSVRGYKTISFLAKQGIQCPNAVGDPALLLPLFYDPKKHIKYKLGIIPHVLDLKTEIINEVLKLHKNVLIIDLAHYGKWTDVVDQICSCEFILSSSLHGLIASDAYGIPNSWIKLSDNVCGGVYFKFLDYFSSVKREEQKPVVVDCVKDLKKAMEVAKQWHQPFIDTDSILESCPFIKH